MLLHLTVHSSVRYTHSCSTLLCTVLSAIRTAAPPYCAQFCPLYTQLLHFTVHSSVLYTHSCSTLLCTVLSSIHTAAPPYCARFCPLYTQLLHLTVHSSVHYTHSTPQHFQQPFSVHQADTASNCFMQLLFLLMTTKKAPKHVAIFYNIVANLIKFYSFFGLNYRN